jgi:predicted adenylyl cyclase CyaB
MKLQNFEFKARVKDLNMLEQKLLKLKPEFRGEDNQTDTYFDVKYGRLKLREGNIEKALIYYERSDSATARPSDIILFRDVAEGSLKEMLVKSLGIRAIVIKKRRIYYIGNVKFHFDVVAGLGTFVEVEALDENGKHDINELEQQCRGFLSYFGLPESDLESKSYSDMILESRY